MKKIVITGADGFIGRHFVDKCLSRETEIYAVVHPKSPNRNCFQSVQNVHTIISSIEELRVEFFPENIDAFYHFAWDGVQADKRDDFDCQVQNIKISTDAVKFAGKLNAKKFITLGSTNEYLYFGKPINKNAAPSPSDSYGSTKLAVRFLTQNLAKKIGIEFIYVVITGIYASDRKDNNVIYYTIDKLLKGQKPSLTKLEQMWDYVHIDDVVEGLYLIGEKGKDGRFYTIGKGDNKPLYTYIQTIRDLIDPKSELGIGDIPYKMNLMPSSCVDLSAINEDTGFVPKIEFEDGIKEVIENLKKENSNEKIS